MLNGRRDTILNYEITLQLIIKFNKSLLISRPPLLILNLTVKLRRNLFLFTTKNFNLIAFYKHFFRSSETAFNYCIRFLWEPRYWETSLGQLAPTNLNYILKKGIMHDNYKSCSFWNEDIIHDTTIAFKFNSSLILILLIFFFMELLKNATYLCSFFSTINLYVIINLFVCFPKN